MSYLYQIAKFEKQLGEIEDEGYLTEWVLDIAYEILPIAIGSGFIPDAMHGGVKMLAIKWLYQSETLWINVHKHKKIEYISTNLGQGYLKEPHEIIGLIEKLFGGRMIE